jgi:ribonucleoside-diphosphate reductase beta chain
MILDPGLNLTLRPMQYPELYKFYKDSIKNHWTVEEVKLNTDLSDLKYKMSPSECHMIGRLVAFFATGDNIVAHNLVINLYKHVNSPEARMYYAQQLKEEMVHVDQYLKLVEEYIPDENDRKAAFEAVEDIPSIKAKASFCYKWMKVGNLDSLKTDEDRKQFLLTLICFAVCVEGLFFMGAFAYVYFLRSKGLLSGLSEATNYIFKDETQHMLFAFTIIEIIRKQYPHLFTAQLETDVKNMLSECIDIEMGFANDALQGGVLGFAVSDMRQFLQYCGDQRLQNLRYKPVYNVKNPFNFMSLQELQPLTNFFEKGVSEYQIGVEGDVSFDQEF